MSFVYAEKWGDTFDVHCDTKIDLEKAPVSFSSEQARLIDKYGIVKTTIICPEISISFAGNDIFRASLLFHRLFEKKTFTTNEVVDMAYETHMEGDINGIEFIVASCENNVLSLHCIKEHSIDRDCQFAWIGSPVAFQEFQEKRLKFNEGKASDRTSTAFLDVVQGCSDKSVGLFHITAGYYPFEKSIRYRECKVLQSSKQQNVLLGDAIRFFLNPADGGFSYEQIPISCEELMLQFDQMDPAVLYSRRLRITNSDLKNDQLFSLMLPMLIKEENGSWMRYR